MYEKLLKTILYVWGFIFLVFAMKFMISHSDSLSQLPQNAWEKVRTYLDELTAKKTLTLSLVEKYGMTIEGVSLCTDNTKDTSVQLRTNSSLGSISSSCWNGDCKVSMEFKEKIPKRIKLNVKLLHSDNCLIESYDASSAAGVVGYQAKFILTDVLKEKLGIASGEKEIHLKHETGYTKTKRNGRYEFTFNFDELPTTDILMVDGDETMEVTFALK